MPKVEQLAKQAALHYFQTTTPPQHTMAQGIEENIYLLTLLDWSSTNFPWKPEHFSPYTTATKYTQMVELYWHMKSFIVQGIEHVLNLHQQQSGQHTTSPNVVKAHDYTTRCMEENLYDLHTKIRLWDRQHL